MTDELGTNIGEVGLTGVRHRNAQLQRQQLQRADYAFFPSGTKPPGCRLADAHGARPKRAHSSSLKSALVAMA